MIDETEVTTPEETPVEGPVEAPVEETPATPEEVVA